MVRPNCTTKPQPPKKTPKPGEGRCGAHTPSFFSCCPPRATTHPNFYLKLDLWPQNRFCCARCARIQPVSIDIIIMRGKAKRLHNDADFKSFRPLSPFIQLAERIGAKSQRRDRPTNQTADQTPGGAKKTLPGHVGAGSLTPISLADLHAPCCVSPTGQGTCAGLS